MMISIGNAPCSWGSLEFEGLDAEPIGYAQMLDELVETGYTGTELGDWGYMPTDAATLAAELAARALTLTGAFVPIAFADESAHTAGEEVALRIATLLAATSQRLGSTVAPFLVLADNNGTVPERTSNAGRVTPQMGLDHTQWHVFARGLDRVARAVLNETGLRSVFHHHCAGYVETPAEIDRLLALTDPATVGLVFDTGHYAYGAGSCEGISAALDRLGDRLWYVHFKDCHPDIAAQARAQNFDYFAAVRRGIFCELGQGCVDFAAVANWLRARNYSGFVTVEQDVLPGLGTPRESALRNRQFLSQLGL